MAAPTSTPDVSVVTVFAPYHAGVVERAAESVAAQTIPVDHLIIADYSGSPAAGRNAGVSQAQTPLVLFLDADDTLAPHAVETLLAYWQPGHYVYCDWQRGDHIVQMPDQFPLPDNPQLHTNTCLISKQLFTRLGGYDPSTDFEDSEFWYRAMSRGVCGIRAPYPLLHYAGEGQRSAEAWQRNRFQFQAIYERYMAMGCGGGCGGTSRVPGSPQQDMGQQMPGDILVAANWRPNRVVVGVITGRKYPRTGWGKTFWADPRDAQASGGLMQPVQPPLTAADDISITDIKTRIQEMTQRG